MTKRYEYFDCDNPYKVLASCIIADYDEESLVEIVNDPAVIRRIMAYEVENNIDFQGPFVDCAMDILLCNQVVKHRRLMAIITDALMDALDIEYLQNEIIEMAAEFGMNIPKID